MTLACGRGMSAVSLLTRSTGSKITAVVPFGINDSWTTMNLAGVGGYTVGVWPTAPGLFTADGSGAGQLDARNADGSANSQANPAQAGSVVSILMTGAGALSPTLSDGALGAADPPYATPVQPIYATINSVPADVVRAAQAPGRVAGIVRLEVQLPAGVTPGDAVVRINVGSGDPGSFLWQPRTTLAVQ